MIRKTALALFVFFSLPVFAERESNGGEYLAMEFVRVARQVHFAIASFPNQQVLSSSDIERFYQAIRHTRVDAVEGPLLDSEGRSVDARLIRDEFGSTIEIDTRRWGYLFNQPRIHGLVFHEYLRVLSLNDEQYIVSGTLNSAPFETYFGQFEVQIGNHTPRWDFLRSLFDQGSRPLWSDAFGVRVGRCFLLDGDQLRVESLVGNVIDAGPAFSRQRRISIKVRAPVENASGGPLEFRDWVVSESSWVLEKTVRLGDLLPTNLRYEIRRFGRYLVAQRRLAGRFDGYCYYWRE